MSKEKDQASKAAGTPEHPPKGKVARTTWALIGLGIISIALAAILLASAAAPSARAPEEPAGTGPAVAEAHEHAWEPIYETVHHEPVTDVVEHPAEYEHVIAYHTICTTCIEKIDGKVQAHQDETGHVGHSTNVPIEEQRVKVDPWEETIILEDTRDEQVAVGLYCPGCGETKPIQDEA